MQALDIETCLNCHSLDLFSVEKIRVAPHLRDGQKTTGTQNTVDLIEAGLTVVDLAQHRHKKGVLWASYEIPMGDNGMIELLANYSWIDEVYFSQFETRFDRAAAYDQLDLVRTQRMIRDYHATRARCRCFPGFENGACLASPISHTLPPGPSIGGLYRTGRA